MARYPVAIKISNLLVYVFLLGANLYSGLGPDNKDSPYNREHPTYISPAPFVFGVWGLIHFLLGGFVIYQFFGSAEELIVDGINWHFVGITLLNTLWLALWQTDHLILSWITILFTSAQVSLVYKILSQYHGEGSTSINERVWVHAPFSLYHAWIFVIAVISTFAAFAPDKVDDEKPSVLVKILVVIGLLVLESTAVTYVEALKGDIAGALVIDWALYGIAAEQEDPVIHWSALVLAVITSLHILKPLYKKYIKGSNEETAPLLGP
jgi:hypothetical protein